MSTSYARVGISMFEHNLREAMDERIIQFTNYIRKEISSNKCPCEAKTRRQWMEEFKKWSEQKFIESEVLKYLKDNP